MLLQVPAKYTVHFQTFQIEPQLILLKKLKQNIGILKSLPIITLFAFIPIKALTKHIIRWLEVNSMLM